MMMASLLHHHHHHHHLNNNTTTTTTLHLRPLSRHQCALVRHHRHHHHHHHCSPLSLRTTASHPLTQKPASSWSPVQHPLSVANPNRQAGSLPASVTNPSSGPRALLSSSVAAAIAAAAAGGMIESGKRGEVRVFEKVDELSTSLANYVAELSDAAVKERGAFSIVLSGGSLISTMGKLCEPPFLKTIDWSKWNVFWADERVVPRNDPESNYKLAKDGLLSKVPVIPGQVYSINDALTAEAAAEDYEFGLRQLVKTRVVDVSPSSDCPRFDLILLGMGPDGHVASLFPGHPLTHEKEKWIAFITDSPKPPPERITFTFPVINSAANVAMVLTGENKADVLAKAFGEELPPGALPVQMVSPKEGKLVWFLDNAAASKL